jgi:hypothetical protein
LDRSFASRLRRPTPPGCKQCLRDKSAVDASEAQRLGQQLARRRSVSRSFHPANGASSGLRRRAIEDRAWNGPRFAPCRHFKQHRDDESAWAPQPQFGGRSLRKRLGRRLPSTGPSAALSRRPINPMVVPVYILERDHRAVGDLFDGPRLSGNELVRKRSAHTESRATAARGELARRNATKVVRYSVLSPRCILVRDERK